MADPNEVQSKPTPGTGPAIWDLVIADARERDVMGTAKYGQRLQAGDGRDHVVDAYQEALDLAVYLRQEIEERRNAADELAALRARVAELKAIVLDQGRADYLALFESRIRADERARAERDIAALCQSVARQWCDAHGDAVINTNITNRIDKGDYPKLPR